jgi:resuscitation-promoting factor RpfB
VALKPGLLILAGGGAIVAIAGVKGWSTGKTIRDILSGHDPSANPTLADQITGSDNDSTGDDGGSAATGTGSVSVSGIANQAIARTLLLAQHPSWTVGQQWNDLVSLWTRESGWSSTAWNPSGAYGVAQALGHGAAYAEVGPRSDGSTTPGVNAAYGGYGMSAASLRAANAGHALPQIQWGIYYIEHVYGSPSAAWAHEVADSWY